MSSFATLFRSSKIASYKARDKQIYTTNPIKQLKGEWGFKKNLPLHFKSSFIQVSSFDNSEKQTLFDSALHSYLINKRIKLNFSNNYQWDGVSKENPKALSDLDPETFINLLNYTKENNIKINNNIKNREFNILFKDFIIKKNQFLKTKAPFTYKIDRNPKIYCDGRPFKDEKNSFVIGINGINARFLRSNSDSSYSINPYVRRRFYILNINISTQGKIIVDVSPNPSSFNHFNNLNLTMNNPNNTETIESPLMDLLANQ